MNECNNGWTKQERKEERKKNKREREREALRRDGRALGLKAIRFFFFNFLRR